MALQYNLRFRTTNQYYQYYKFHCRQGQSILDNLCMNSSRILRDFVKSSTKRCVPLDDCTTVDRCKYKSFTDFILFLFLLLFILSLLQFLVVGLCTLLMIGLWLLDAEAVAVVVRADYCSINTCSCTGITFNCISNRQCILQLHLHLL